MPDYDEPVRASGPTVVHGGPGETTVLVLDPAGIGKHGELPAAWRENAERFRVAWFRLPATDFDPGDVLDLLDATTTPVYLVAGGPAAVDALSVALARRQRVRAVLLVDPVFEGPAGDDATPGRTIASAREHGVQVQLIAEDRDPAEDDGGEPLPLGHPQVARDVAALLG